MCPLDLRQDNFRRSHVLQVLSLPKAMRSGEKGSFFVQPPESSNGKRRLVNDRKRNEH